MSDPLASWDHDRTVSVDLPRSQRTVPFELPDFQLFLARGYIPNPLANMATRVEYEGVSMTTFETMPDQERGDLFDLMCWVVANGLRRAEGSELAESPEVDVVRMVTEKMHPDDRLVLWMRAMHIGLEEGLQTLASVYRFRDAAARAGVLPDDDSDGGEAQ